MENNMLLSVNPHVYAARNTRGVMLEVIIALLPAAAAAVYFFGMPSALVIATCVISSVIFELLFTKITGRKTTIGDLSAVVTGLLLALNLPANIPLWQAAVGCFIAIVVAKCLFGGLGYNFANPAITARVAMLIAFTGTMTAAVFPIQNADLEASATPLSVLASGETVNATLLDMFLGNRGGALGETSALALLIGGIFLVVRKVITWHTPVAFIGTVFVGSLLIAGDMTTALYYTLSGGLFIGAIFMATDYVTTPCTPKGKLIFGIGCGIITILIRFFGSYPEGVSFSILLMNILTPYIEKWTMLKPFGGVKA